jgi:predicted RNA-binding Zn-ribbon protein involved in translation (DUF1610 family)
MPPTPAANPPSPDTSDKPPPRRYASVIKARKSHTCTTCGRQIQPKESYEYSYEHGGVNEMKRCKDCIG